jgi:hypothetical protein
MFQDPIPLFTYSTYFNVNENKILSYGNCFSFGPILHMEIYTPRKKTAIVGNAGLEIAIA